MNKYEVLLPAKCAGIILNLYINGIITKRTQTLLIEYIMLKNLFRINPTTENLLKLFDNEIFKNYLLDKISNIEYDVIHSELQKYK